MSADSLRPFAFFPGNRASLDRVRALAVREERSFRPMARSIIGTLPILNSVIDARVFRVFFIRSDLSPGAAYAPLA